MRTQLRGTSGVAASIPTHAIVARFNYADGAHHALVALQDAIAMLNLDTKNVAVLEVRDDGKLRIRETDDMRGGKGAVAGGVVGGMLGLFGSAVLWPLGLGVAAGGLAAKLRDSGFPNDRLQEIAAQLKPGNSLLIVAVDDASAGAVIGVLKDAGASVIREALDGKVVEDLEQSAATGSQRDLHLEFDGSARTNWSDATPQSREAGTGPATTTHAQ
jgi:uncharacterized membrane protein